MTFIPELRYRGHSVHAHFECRSDQLITHSEMSDPSSSVGGHRYLRHSHQRSWAHLAESETEAPSKEPPSGIEMVIAVRGRWPCPIRSPLTPHRGAPLIVGGDTRKRTIPAGRQGDKTEQSQLCTVCMYVHFFVLTSQSRKQISSFSDITLSKQSLH